MSEEQTPASPAQRRWIGLFCIAAGLYLLLIATDVLPIQPGSLNAPRPIVAVVSAIFMLTGVLAVRWWPEDSRINGVLGAAILTLFAAAGAWVALYGRAGAFRGEVAVGAVSAPIQAPGLARAAFGLGSLITLTAAVYAWRRVFRNRR